jgi:diguanylate cyclase (GGDEF)-like protein/PAS domain S-box-containing protein
LSRTVVRRKAGRSPAPASSAAQAPRQIRVLLVEDSEAEAALVLHALQSAGWGVDAERVDREAALLDSLQRAVPDLVLCDFVVPGFGGLAALRALKGFDPDIPCIFVSSRIGEEKAVELIKSGADDFVLKSALERLPAAIERAFRERDARRALARTQKALAESESRFRSLTELSADWYWEQDAEHRFTGLTGSYVQQPPGRVSAKLGKRRWELPEYRMTGEEWERYRATIAQRQPFRDMEFRYLMDGQVRNMAISGEPVFDGEGVFTGYRGIGRDITERKQAEESLRRFRAAMEVSADAILIVDAGLRIVDVNATACSATGFDRDTLQGMTADRLLPRFSRAEVVAGFRSSIAHLPKTWRFETDIRRRDGSEYPVEVHQCAIESADGHLVVAIARDISEQRCMIGQLEARTRQQSTIAALGEYALQEKNLGVVMQRTVGEVARVLGAGFARVLERLPEGRALVLRAAHGWPASAIGTLQVDSGPASAAGKALDATQGIVLADLERDQSFDAGALRRYGIASGISVVIGGHEGPYGVLEVHSTEAREFSEDDRNFLTAIANVLAAAIERRRSDASLRLRERALEASVSAIVITDARKPDHPIEYVNPAFERITGYPAHEVIGRNCRFLQWNDDGQPQLEAIRSAIRTQTEGRAVLRNYTRDGRLFWNELHVAPVRDERGAVTHFIGVQNDVSEALRYQQQLEHQATHDELTGLPNRNLLRDRLSQAVLLAQRSRQQVVVAFVDLDHFKYVNDSLGHVAGDDVLQTVAARITACLRDGDTVARIGGDEFVLVLGEQPDVDFASEAMARICERVADPVTVDGREFHLSCSIGLSVYPQDGRDADELLKHADVAMYRAKEQGRNAVVFYSEDMNAHINERLALEASLRRALGRGEFQLHYQPRVSLAERRITGVEALIRWNHAELGTVSPARFITLAEELGLIGVIGEWVLRTACEQLRAWREAGLGPLVMAVNISARQLSDPRLVDTVAGLLRETGIEGRWLELEITESAMMRNPILTERALSDLHELGVAIAIDDFGTGYSSLSYLKNFRIDCLKIDQSFVRGLPLDKDDVEITRAIIALGRSLKMRLAAEGIERDEQQAFLEAVGCDEGQGYLFSRPLAAAPMAQLLATGFPAQPGRGPSGG